jgi:hypothetical protein
MVRQYSSWKKNTTTASKKKRMDEEARALLKSFGMPFTAA